MHEQHPHRQKRRYAQPDSSDIFGRYNHHRALFAFYVATEYGVVNLAGLTTWERADAMKALLTPISAMSL